MSTEVPRAYLEVLELSEGLVDATAVAQAVELWRSPVWRIAVVGRVAVGKSSLVNLLSPEAHRPTGLGGITRDVALVSTPLAPDALLLDTPGIDGAERAPASLDAVLESADAVVWVVDGLQPVTHTEREVLETRIPAGCTVHIVVSRLDLVATAEVDEVLARSRALTRPWAPRSVRRLDLRRAETPPLDLLQPSPWPSQRRARALSSAVLELSTQLRAAPPRVDARALWERLQARWREVARGAEREVEEAIHAERVSDRATALRNLRRVGFTARADFLGWALEQPEVVQLDLDPEDLLLPLPDPPDATLVRALLDGLGGTGTAIRDLRARAGRWMMDGELALSDWLGPQVDGTEPTTDAQARFDLLQALDRALELDLS